MTVTTVVVGVAGGLFGGLIGGAAVLVGARAGVRALSRFGLLLMMSMITTYGSALAADTGNARRLGLVLASLGAFLFIAAVVHLLSLAQRHRRLAAASNGTP